MFKSASNGFAIASTQDGPSCLRNREAIHPRVVELFSFKSSLVALLSFATARESVSCHSELQWLQAMQQQKNAHQANCPRERKPPLRKLQALQPCCMRCKAREKSGCRWIYRMRGHLDNSRKQKEKGSISCRPDQEAER